MMKDESSYFFVLIKIFNFIIVRIICFVFRCQLSADVSTSNSSYYFLEDLVELLTKDDGNY